MALHGKQSRTPKQIATHYAKPSRLARFGRRWDARLAEMRAEFEFRALWDEALRMDNEWETARLASVEAA